MTSFHWSSKNHLGNRRWGYAWGVHKLPKNPYYWHHRKSVQAPTVCAERGSATSGPTTSRVQAGPPGLQGVARCNCSISCRRLPACQSRRPSPAPIGRHRHVLRSTDQHTARRSELRSRWTTALEQSAVQDSPARQRHRRISSAAEVVFV